MSSNPVDNTSSTPVATDVVAQAKQRLRKFFQNEYVKDLVSVIVPGALAAILFPVFGPVVAAPAAAVAVHNGLKAFGISFSSDSIEKLIQPLEGKQISENDVKAVVKEMIVKDDQVNKEAAKALVTVIPEVKEAALTNPELDPKWLGTSLQTSLEQQGGEMAKIAPEVDKLVQLDDAQLITARDELLANWSRIIQEVSALKGSKVSDVAQDVEGQGGQINQRVAAEDHSEIKGVKQNVRQQKQS